MTCANCGRQRKVTVGMDEDGPASWSLCVPCWIDGIRTKAKPPTLETSLPGISPEPAKRGRKRGT